MYRYFIVYKPYNMISQFVSPYQHRLLGDLDFDFPEGTHAVGRLDEESEGLLILTTDKTLTRRLLHPSKQHRRSYLVQVKKRVEPETIEMLCAGLEILVKGRGAYLTQPCHVKLLEKPFALPEREPMVKEYVQHSWLEFTLTEGKNRQIRKMCTAVKHPCTRLVRTKIEDLELGDLQPGQVKEMSQPDLFRLLRL